MSKTLKFIIFILFSLLAVLIFKSLSTDAPSSHAIDDTILLAAESKYLKNKNKTTNTISKIESKDEEQKERLKFEIDLQLSKDLNNALMTEDYESRVSEIVRLADTHTENPLLQYLAATNCLLKKQTICDSQKFSQRLLSIKPNSATAKSFLAALYLKNNDNESALIELAKIQADDSYSSFFYDVTQSLEPGLNEKLEVKQAQTEDRIFSVLESFEKNAPDKYSSNTYDINDVMKNLVRTQSIGIAAAQHAIYDPATTCIKNIKDQNTSQRWLNPCMKLASSMTSSDTAIDSLMARELQVIIYEAQGDEANLIKTQSLQNEFSVVFKNATRIMSDPGFLLSKEFDFYYQESIEYGEYQAMKNLIERENE